jgi:hypothetical protein
MTQLQLPGEARTSHLFLLEHLWRCGPDPRYTADSMSDLTLIQQGLQHIQYGSEVNSTLNELVQLAVSAAKSEAGSLALMDQERKTLRITVAVGLPDEYVKGCGEISLGDQCCGRAALHRKPWIVSGHAQ